MKCNDINENGISMIIPLRKEAINGIVEIML